VGLVNIYKIHQSRELPGDKIFELHATHGLPFAVSAQIACDMRMTIDWIGFYECAKLAGWKTRGLLKRLRQACIDAGYNDKIMVEIEQM
jgi:alanyl-tRNA synthetase